MSIFINNVSEYVQEIIRIRNLWSVKDPYPDIWFRGLNNETHELRPGAYWRTECDEFSLAATFRALSPLLLNPKPITEWDWYYAMQHYGIPTRLLDWTESPLQALHFALTGNTFSENPCVWILDPLELNQYTQKKNIVYVPDSFKIYDEIDAWLPNRCWKNNKPEIFRNCQYLKTNALPIAIYPSRSNPRLFAQRGTFTVHGTKNIAIESLPLKRKRNSPSIIKITINRYNIEELRRDLWALGFNKSATFPEPENVAFDVKLQYGINL